jgi:antitoxin (DNA-binding transcriptional repressor) of toxin-antitoxin stability system
MWDATDMVTIGIRELRHHLSRYIRLAKEGRRVPVTERGTLVAYLAPAGDPAAAGPVAACPGTRTRPVLTP